ncbi:MAG TPA: PAS domain S-box protein [Gemmatimonadales bacterium]|nr:PAS domain S-box protein [Gemmatimonadales bacterium]
MTTDPAKRESPPVGLRALRSGPALTIALALLVAALASSAYAVPAPTVFLLITVVYAAALGGWKAGLASGLVALLYLGWLLTDAGHAAQYEPLDRTFLTIGGVALPLAGLAGWVLHRLLQSGRAVDWYRSRVTAYQEGEIHSWVESDHRFRTLVEQVRDYAIFMVDPEGRHTTWNEGVRRLLGYDEGEFLGQPGTLLFTPEDRESGEHERELRTAAERGRASDDRWLVRKDGSRFWATGITARMNDASGRLIGFSKVFRDLTDEKIAQDRLRESEERLRVALQAAHMGIWRWHLPTNTQRVDGSMARLLGLGDGEVVESFEQFREHVHPDDRERVAAAFEQAVQDGGEMQVEFRVVWPDGTIRWLSDHGEVVRDASGAPEYLTGAAVDVTDRKLAEERLVQAQRMDAVGHLAGGVAHEINNMMTVVLGFSTLLLDALGNGPHAAEVRQIHRAASRASTITNQLLAFSRRQPQQSQVIDVNEVMRGAEHMLRRVLGEDKGFVMDLADELGSVRADAGQLEQVLLNLTLNARDAMAAGGTLTITTRSVTLQSRDGARPRDEELPPGSYVRITVSDTGHGMDAATRARVFEPFFTTKPVGQGSGLGLAAVFGIVSQSGGTVRVRSSPGEGTTFSIYLPQVPADVDSNDGQRQVPRGQRGTGTVLVVEDEAMVREFACRVLAAYGYQCVEATNGVDALEIVQERGELIDAVVTDVVMPGVGGGTLAKRLAELRPTLPVLFTSAHSGEEVVRRGLIPPGAPFLQKPFTPQALVVRLQDLSRSPR